MPPTPIRVVLADDHPIIREGLRATLDSDPRVAVVGEAGSFAEVVRALAATPTDVLVLDLSGMGGSAIAIINRLRISSPRLKVLVFSSIVDLAPEMLAAGAAGYIVKEDLTAKLLDAILDVTQGRTVLSDAVAAYLEQAEGVAAGARLSASELSVLKLLTQGMSTHEIADQLVLSYRTVENYIVSARRKLSCTERTELAAWYRRTFPDAAP